MTNAFVESLLLGGVLGGCSTGLALAWGRVRGPWGTPGPGAAEGAPLVPLTGGHGIGLGLIAGAGILERFPPAGPVPAAVVVLGSLFLALGILDDLHRPSPRLRLVVEAIVGAGSAFCIAPVLGGGSLLMTLLWVLIVVNGTNFLDGSDGAAGSASLGSLVAIGLLGTGGSAVVGGLCAGILVPFLILNCARPSRLQLGDGGARMVGAILAVLSLPYLYGGRWVTAIGLVLLPVAEVGTTVARRVYGRRRLLVGDRQHLGDRLLERGWSPRQVATVAFLISFCCASLCLWGG